MRRFVALTLLAAALASPAGGQAPPQFRADVSQTGDTPFTGTISVGASKVRVEGTSNGEPMTMIIDSSTGTIMMLMADQRAYVTMDAGSMPFSAPGSTSMDPANPCSSGELTECESLGTENINGRSARGWEYTRDGERETAWIASDLRFPVRVIDADGGQSDFTNVTTGNQPASLFEPPADYTAMDMGGMFGGRGGRGFGGPPPGAGRGGRGAPPAGRGAPPAGRGAPPGALPPGGDPSAQLAQQLAAMGLPPDQIAAALAQMNAAAIPTNSAPWEQGDGWVVDLVITASGSDSGEVPVTGGSFSETYSARITASVPFTYGTPAVGAAMGPAWQLVPTLGSPRALQEPFVMSATSQYHYEGNNPAECPINDAGRTVADGTGSAQVRTTDHNTMPIMGIQARWEISGDLSTHHIMVAAGTEGTETITTVGTSMGACGGSPSTQTNTQTNTPQVAVSVDLPNLPLPQSPGTFRGTGTVTMQYYIAGKRLELPSQVEWTLRPIQ